MHRAPVFPVTAREPVQVDASRVLGVSVGVRPYRASGFRVEGEHRGDRLLIHHYGHGGSGITLSWGSAQLVLEHVRAAGERHVAVLGAGAVGLATARVLQEHGYSVDVYAEARPPYTTSDAAGAFWGPFRLFDPERATPSFRRALPGVVRGSRAAFDALATNPRYGIRKLPLHYLGPRAASNCAPESPQLLPEMAAAPELFAGELLAPGAHPFGERQAISMEGMAIEPRLYLQAVLEDVLAAGGAVHPMRIRSSADLAEVPAAVIVNALGLGARAICEDPDLVADKGQLVLLEPQHAVDYIVVAPSDGLYMLPRGDAIVLGTGHQPGCETPEADASETERILAGHRELFGR